MLPLNQLCQKSLKAFCSFLKQDFDSPIHVSAIIKALEDVESGKIKRLIISCPPRHGKTLTSSILFPAWYLGRNPTKDMILVSYNETLANDFGRQIRNHMLSNEYKTVFETRIAADSSSMKHFNTAQGGALTATGMEGTLTGRGGNIIIVDDLVKNEKEARSFVYRANMAQFWDNTLYTRQQNKDAAFIIVNNRWHEMDLIGHIIKNSNETWHHLKFPAISATGEALWPDKFDLNFFKTIQAGKTVHTFQTQYQQEPFSEQGDYIKIDELQLVKASEIPTDCDSYVISFDLTFKGGTENDFNVGQFWGYKAPNFYLIDQIRGQWDFTQQLFHMKHFLNKHSKCCNILIEDAANGAAVVSVLESSIPGIQLWKPEGDKINRVTSVSPLFRAMNVFINKEIPEIDSFLHEITAFPNAENDDTVDTCTMSLIQLKNQPKTVYMALGEGLF